MAAVLPLDDNDYLAVSGLRRSHFHSKFTSLTSPDSTSSHLSDHYKPGSNSYAGPNSSSSPSSPRTAHADSVELSYASTLATNLSIDSDYDGTSGLAESPKDHLMFPSFAQEKLSVHPEIRPNIHYNDNLELSPSPRTDDSYTVSPVEHENSEEVSHDTSRPYELEHERSEHAEDDTAVSSRPSHQVDYLSHKWREEDIWSSWRYIVIRRGKFPNSARLENASWRAWMKGKNNLKTISPESLNWFAPLECSFSFIKILSSTRLKDYDVTWLYGPLQSGPKNLHPIHTEPSSVSLSKADSPINFNKKSILKKRSMSEIMLQRSLSRPSLLKPAATALKAQETQGFLRLHLGRSSTDCVAHPFALCRLSGESSSIAPPVESPRMISPSSERKHIHFNEQVEQCIAVEAKDDDNQDMIDDCYGFDSDLDDGIIIKRVKTKRRSISRRKSLKPKPAAKGKTIAMLPSTTLKYRKDTPESRETAMEDSPSPVMSPSSTQKTLRSAKQSGRFLFGEEGNNGGLDDTLSGTRSGWALPPTEDTVGDLNRSIPSGSLYEEPAGMRRTPSGMFMPYEEVKIQSEDGIFCRVINTVNTARDIAHIMWNAGWRK